jgi:hypothetical protein
MEAWGECNRFPNRNTDEVEWGRWFVNSRDEYRDGGPRIAGSKRGSGRWWPGSLNNSVVFGWGGGTVTASSSQSSKGPRWPVRNELHLLPTCSVRVFQRVHQLISSHSMPASPCGRSTTATTCLPVGRASYHMRWHRKMPDADVCWAGCFKNNLIQRLKPSARV